jgi:prepilin-type processing-associated H-X9-DG protein
MPAEMIVVVDSMADGRWDFAAIPNHPDPRMWPGNVHGGGANVLFCDGHARWYSQKELLVAERYLPGEAPIRRMWNNNHEPD